MQFLDFRQGIEYFLCYALTEMPLVLDVLSEESQVESLQYASERAKNRYIVKDGQLHALPMSPASFVSPGTGLKSPISLFRIKPPPVTTMAEP